MFFALFTHTLILSEVKCTLYLRVIRVGCKAYCVKVKVEA